MKADKKMEAVKSQKQQVKKRKEESRRKEEAKQAEENRSIKDMMNLWKVRVEGAQGASPGNPLPNDKNFGRNKGGRKSPVSRKEALRKEQLKNERKEDSGQRSSSSGSQGKICWNNLDRGRSEEETARMNPHTWKEKLRKEEMNEEALVEQGRKEAAGVDSSPSGSSSSCTKGNNWKDNVVRKQDGGGTIFKMARNTEQQVELDKDMAKAANEDREEIATQKEQEHEQVETMVAKAVNQVREEGVTTQQEQEQRQVETMVEEQQAELDKDQAKAADHGVATQQEQEQRQVETMGEGRRKEPPTLEHCKELSNCVVRGKPIAAKRKEQGRKITDLIRGFNAMTDTEQMTGGKNRSLNNTP